MPGNDREAPPSSQNRYMALGVWAVCLLAMIAAVVAVATGGVKPGDFWNAVSAAVAISVLVLICGAGSAVVWAMIDGRIDLRYLLSEPGGPDATGKASHKASLSRFQFLIFTFVIAGLYLALSFEKGALLDIPEHVLMLLGISSATYGASKGISEFSPNRGTTGGAQTPGNGGADGGQDDDNAQDQNKQGG